MLQHPQLDNFLKKITFIRLVLVNRFNPHLMKQSKREVFLLCKMWVESILFLTISGRCDTRPTMDF